MQKDYRIILFVFFLLGIFFFQSVTSMQEKSATFDEPVHLAAGYSYLKTGDYRMNKEHPPLMKMLNALPLLFLNPSLPLEHSSWREVREFRFGEEFLYHNRVDADKLLFWGRLSTVLLALVLGFFVFKWAKELFGTNAGLLALFLYILCPNILANSQMVTTDLAASCFVFLSIYSLWKYLKQRNFVNIIFSGVTLGLALASKFTTVILFPIHLFIFLLFLRKEKKQPIYWRDFALIFVLAMLVLSLTYRFVYFENYFQGLRRIIFEASKFGHEAYLFGGYSKTGWRSYYLIAFLLKTPLPLVLLLLLYPWLKRKLKIKGDYFLLIPVVFVFLSASLSKKQVGLRYILPIYPFLFVLLSQRIQLLALPRTKFGAGTRVFRLQFLIFSFLCIWYLVSSLKIYPHYLSYFNELAGGPDKGWKYLADSNIDWGQDLKGLKKYLVKEGNPEIILSYFGASNPFYYGIDCQNLVSYGAIPRVTGRINSLSPWRELLAVSASNLVCIYFPDRHLFDWLKKKKPIKKIGYSIFIYDITEDLNAHENLVQIYYNNGKIKEAERESQRLLILNPENTVGHFTLACLYAQTGKEGEAISEYEKAMRLNPEFLPERYNYYGYESGAGSSELYYRSLFALGSIYFKKRNNQRALSVYEKIVKLYPDSTEGYANLGVVFENLGEHGKAISAYQKAIQLKPDFTDGYFNLGVVYWKQKNWDLVVKNFLEVLKINPQHKEARKYLELVQEKMK